MIEHQKIALITPLKDEIENIERYFESLSAQTHFIEHVVIVENDSIDGSKEYLKNLGKIENIGRVTVLNLEFKEKEYDLELRYSKIINAGYEFLKTTVNYKNLSYVGILDCDCFPRKNYYSKIIELLHSKEKLGIASGVIYTHEGKLHRANINWVRGGIRIWKRKCLDETGIPVEPSPDTITVALAHLNGWTTETLKDAVVISREVNERLQNFKNFGHRAYYRGHTLIFALLKSLHFIFIKFEPKVGIDFLHGFISDYIKANPRIKNKKVKKYYQNYLIGKLSKKFVP